MMQLQISNPKMQKIFETQFHSNTDKFMEFIVNFVKDNSKVVDSYIHNTTTPKKFSYQKLDPMENFYTLDKDDNHIEMTNPFEDVQDSVTFAKQLREDSYR
ncbi:MAG: Unknown protein [uncultured Sulfurovum sp.]|uniref:Uncharacterized protein n=1 Tax=uncultured Sulfurovum sp. TaxID=269237 RepID=A0A6S6SZ55_9BACT|nr:MAG: Unknown protein [uncultured Sulfurovum sp.]